MSDAAPTLAEDLGHIGGSPGAETWIEYDAPDDRRRIGFHDYAALYAVPGLYERVFYHELGMRSTHVVAGLYAAVLDTLGRDAGAERVLDLGARNGLGGEALRRVGIGHVTGIDLEPMARDAAERDRPGVYDAYLAGDILTLTSTHAEVFETCAPTAILAMSALGPGHAPPEVLSCALDLLPAGGLCAFAVTPTLLPGSDDPRGRASGYPDFLTALLRGRAEQLATDAYVHRLRPDGSEDPAVAFVVRMT